MLLVALDRWSSYTERLHGNLLGWTQDWSSYGGGRLNMLDCINIITTILIILRPKIMVFFLLILLSPNLHYFLQQIHQNNSLFYH